MKLKIAVLGTRGFPNVQGGVEAHCENLYTRLVKQGCEVTVFARAPYLEKNKEKVKINHLNNERNLREKLSYSYVRRQLIQHNGFPKEYITDELIEFKRIQIKLKRLLRGELA